MQNEGFNKKQKQEIAGIVTEIVSDQLSEVLKPFIKVQNDRWTENDKRWEEADQKFIQIQNQLNHMERVMNAHTVELHNISQKLDAFIDRSVDHHEKLEDHEKRISSLESLVTS